MPSFRIAGLFFPITAWEDSFLDRVNELRNEELAVLRRFNVMEAMVIVVFLVLPVWMSLTTFGVYAGTGHKMNPGSVFRVVALFNALRFPLINLPSSLNSIMSGGVSVKRVQKFLETDDIGDNRKDVSANSRDKSVTSEPDSTKVSTGATKVLTTELQTWDNSYYIHNGTYRWSAGQPSPSLTDVTIKIPKGRLIGIVGMVRVLPRYIPVDNNCS